MRKAKEVHLQAPVTQQAYRRCKQRDGKAMIIIFLGWIEGIAEKYQLRV